ncbi:MAG TPA: hypothetical protein VFI58_12590 [Xanthobacteraceae bacterium]|jgi:hypothetical protein|nr:hypothetical protein [Xanthobacteraceae bacterium]
MRKLMIVTAMVAIAATAVIWSIATVAGPKFAGKVDEASAPISTHEIMIKHGKPLRAETWDAF